MTQMGTIIEQLIRDHVESVVTQAIQGARPVVVDLVKETVNGLDTPVRLTESDKSDILDEVYDRVRDYMEQHPSQFRGEDGEDGRDGSDGDDGRDGEDGYSPSVDEVIQTITSLAEGMPASYTSRCDFGKAFSRAVESVLKDGHDDDALAEAMIAREVFDNDRLMAYLRRSLGFTSYEEGDTNPTYNTIVRHFEGGDSHNGSALTRLIHAKMRDLDLLPTGDVRVTPTKWDARATDMQELIYTTITEYMTEREGNGSVLTEQVMLKLQSNTHARRLLMDAMRPSIVELLESELIRQTNNRMMSTDNRMDALREENRMLRVEQEAITGELRAAQALMEQLRGDLAALSSVGDHCQTDRDSIRPLVKLVAQYLSDARVGGSLDPDIEPIRAMLREM